MGNDIEFVKSRFEQDRYAKIFGIVLDELTENTVRMHMKLTGDMLNWFNMPHGAAIYSLADAAFSVLSNAGTNLSVALNCSITYYSSPIKESDLTVHGETIARTEQTSIFSFDVYSTKNDANILIATMKGISYRTGKSIGAILD